MDISLDIRKFSKRVIKILGAPTLATISGIFIFSFLLGFTDVNPNYAPKDKYFKILYYASLEQDSDLVVINVGKKDGLNEESVLKSFRPSKNNIMIETGTLKAVQVEDDFTVAQITTQGSPASRSLFPKFPGIMAGDLTKIPDIRITPNQVLAPTLTFEYRSLFEDPKALPHTYELSEKGMQKLTDAIPELANMKLSLLMIEGYTDAAGSSEQNQIESYQRAAAVRQFLISELGFDEERTVAVGFGESAVSEDSQVPEYSAKQRKIVLKTLSSQD